MNVRTYALEAKYEFLKQVRMPAYALPSITFPVMFYLLFGVLFGGGRMSCDIVDTRRPSTRKVRLPPIRGS